MPAGLTFPMFPGMMGFPMSQFTVAPPAQNIASPGGRPPPAHPNFANWNIRIPGEQGNSGTGNTKFKVPAVMFHNPPANFAPPTDLSNSRSQAVYFPELKPPTTSRPVKNPPKINRNQNQNIKNVNDQNVPKKSGTDRVVDDQVDVLSTKGDITKSGSGTGMLMFK